MLSEGQKDVTVPWVSNGLIVIWKQVPDTALGGSVVGESSGER